MKTKLIQTKDYLLLIDIEAEIKENGLFIGNNKLFQLDPDEWLICKCESIKGVDYLMCDGVGYTKGYNAFSLIAYYPLTKEAKELDLPLLPNPFETDIEQIAKDTILTDGINPTSNIHGQIIGFQLGYKAAQSKQFSLEDIVSFGRMCFYEGLQRNLEESLRDIPEDDLLFFNQIINENELIQSLSTQQLPKEFIPEYNVHMEAMDMPRIHIQKEVKTLKTITNSEGKQELVGTYKY